VTHEEHAGRGVPGEGKGRRDEVGRTGIWPASGPPPPDGQTRLVGQGDMIGEPSALTGAEVPIGAGEFETDPVCGMRVNIRQAERREFRGHAYYFDSSLCCERFDAAPERFATLPERRSR